MGVECGKVKAEGHGGRPIARRRVNSAARSASIDMQCLGRSLFSDPVIAGRSQSEPGTQEDTANVLSTFSGL
jgi:hypothetical protein